MGDTVRCEVRRMKRTLDLREHTDTGVLKAGQEILITAYLPDSGARVYLIVPQGGLVQLLSFEYTPSDIHDEETDGYYEYQYYQRVLKASTPIQSRQGWCAVQQVWTTALLGDTQKLPVSRESWITEMLDRVLDATGMSARECIDLCTYKGEPIGRAQWEILQEIRQAPLEDLPVHMDKGFDDLIAERLKKGV